MRNRQDDTLQTENVPRNNSFEWEDFTGVLVTEVNFGETIVLDSAGQTIATIRINEIKGSSVKVGIKARRNVRIRRN